jgi:Apea-like HEPN
MRRASVSSNSVSSHRTALRHKARIGRRSRIAQRSGSDVRHQSRAVARQVAVAENDDLDRWAFVGPDQEANQRRIQNVPTRSRRATSTRLPPLKPLATSIAATHVSKKVKVEGSAQYLAAHSADLRNWEGIEHLAEDAFVSEPPDSIARAAAHHIQAVRSEMARQLWSRKIFVGVSVLDELILRSAQAGSSDVILGALQRLRDSELNHPGLVVLPLHSFGILAAGILRPLRGQSISLMNSRDGFAITPQTNNLQRTISFIDAACFAMGLPKPVDPDLIRHWHQSRAARWLDRNPLRIAAVTSISGYYYGNEFLLLGRLRAITSAVVMLFALQPRQEDRVARVFSSRQINNFETRDLRHYLVLSPGRTKYMSGHAVPIHRRRQVDELTDLAVDIDTRYWQRRSSAAEGIYSSVDELYTGYLRYNFGSPQGVNLARVYRKLFDAVSYFRRSFLAEGEGYTAVLSLATAFEMLLTDSYSPDVAKRLRRRIKLLLRGVRGTLRYQQAVEDLYHARNRTVHAGTEESLDLSDARRAFVLAFIALMPRVSGLTGSESSPIAILTGDL